MSNPTNGNLRSLGFSLNVPAQQPPPSPQQEVHTFGHNSQDDGYYADGYSERFDGQENYYDYNDEGYSDDRTQVEGEKMTIWQDPWEIDSIDSFPKGGGGADLGSVVSIHQGAHTAEHAELGSDENTQNYSAGSAFSRPIIHPAIIDALNKHVGQDSAENVPGPVQSSASNVDYHDATNTLEDSNAVITKKLETGSLMDNSVSNLLITSPLSGEDQAILEEKQQAEEAVNGSKNTYTVSEVDPEEDGQMEEKILDNNVQLMSGEFEAIVSPPDLNQPEGATVTGELKEEGELTGEQNGLLLEGNAIGEIKEVAFPSEMDERVNVQDVEGVDTFDEQVQEGGDEINTIMFPDEEETISNEVENGEDKSAGGLEIGEDLDNQNQHYKNQVGSVARDSTIDLEIEADLTGKKYSNQEESKISVAEDNPEDLGQVEGQNETQQIETQENVLSTTATEQGTEINDESNESSFKGFDEDFSSGHIDISKHEQPPDASESQVVSNTQISNNYTGDGFTYHVLQPTSRDHGLVNSIYVFAIATVIGTLFCFCCIRYKRRHGRHSRPNRGKYSAIGNDDFFNGTFSDDISFNGKDSDDDMSFGSDDGDVVKIELGGIHELDANGGLTLEEING
ncbi:hypothetical protein ACHAW6_015745 [Cyclotella cf. meneghiniana]